MEAARRSDGDGQALLNEVSLLGSSSAALQILPEAERPLYVPDFARLEIFQEARNPRDVIFTQFIV